MSRRKFRTVASLAALVFAVTQPINASQTQVRIPKPVRDAIHIETWVRWGLFAEADQKMHTEGTLHAPRLMRFKWGTDAEGADDATWQLVRIGPRVSQRTVLASGVTGTGPGGIFTIDLRQYLPPEPPERGGRYHVEVRARKKGSITSTTATMPGQSGAKLAARSLGLWSPPVVLTYVKGDPTDQQFSFPEIYRKATLYLDQFELVEDQFGPGEEEYHIGGFIQELFQTPGPDAKFDRPGALIKLGPYYREMNPPQTTGFLAGPPPALPADYQKLEWEHWTIPLTTETDKWPRRFVVAASVLEEDDGDNVGDWKKGLRALQDELVKGDILKFSQKQLEDYIRENGLGDVRFFMDVASVIAEAAGAATGPTMIAVTAAVIAATYISWIVEDMADDYYGTKAATLTLPSNRVEEIRKLPGKLIDPGTPQERYIMSQQVLEFRGPAPAGSAVNCCDGRVKLKFHWEFSDRDFQ